ncbi:hypothetical protein F2Q70_00016337 [Brassica cretica]|uniref:Uncharacterized protein n=1 Tax=Brassica cretica TaxID=69181 RepID=A0A8S9HQR8_BRACR|nr:hypothetical protein F2Q70_00016337 [Brassica cretica]KAF2601070.1 hypothetical protein F2Q68_00009307 [Brassica cretica]
MHVMVSGLGNHDERLARDASVFERKERPERVICNKNSCTGGRVHDLQLEIDLSHLGWRIFQDGVNHWLSILEDVLIDSAEGVSWPGVSRSVNKYKAHHKDICKRSLTIEDHEIWAEYDAGKGKTCSPAHLKLKSLTERSFHEGLNARKSRLHLREQNKRVQVIDGDAQVSVLETSQYKNEQVDQMVEQRYLCRKSS